MTDTNNVVACGTSKLPHLVVEITKTYGEFSFKKLGVTLDYAPWEGASRVADTFNLIGHALELLVCTAALVSEKLAVKIREKRNVNY